jgi:predicted nucleic acid-binding protein
VYLLDTNVVSELRQRRARPPDRAVLDWFTAVPAEQTHISVLTMFELELGVLLSERRDPAAGRVLRDWMTELVHGGFKGRVIPVDPAVASDAARLHVPDPRPEIDSLLAATAVVHGLILVTRNTADFRARGLRLLNPWDLAS